jgi:hypothetical protein
MTATKMPPLHQHEEEKFFLNAKGQKETLPSIWDKPTKQLSVVVPSYNEEKRCKLFVVLIRGNLGRKGNLKRLTSLSLKVGLWVIT